MGENRKSEIYYYLIKTNKEPDVTKVNYAKHEKQGNFKIDKIPLNSAIEIIRKTYQIMKKIELLHLI